ncbi:MAG: autotransporter assembly complex family protein [Burkholderiales bacterium]
MSGAIARGVLAMLLWLAAAPPAAAQEVKYRVDIEAPKTLRELLEQHLDVVRRAAEANVNADEVRRLFARAPDRIRALVATEGYFSPSIDATIDDHASPWKLAFVVDPGTRAVVRNVDLRFQGAVLVASPHNEERIARLKAEWKLQPGEPFRSEVWEAAKRDTLRDLLIVLYPTARIVDSRATVNPETATVDLFAEFDSGPAVTVGQLEVTGLTRYQRSIVDGMNTIAPGSAYSQVQLLRFQQRLQNSGYFSSVSVRVDPDAAQPGDTPIIVDVVERKTQRLAFGLGYSTNYGPRAQVDYQHVNLFDRAWRFNVRTIADLKEQSLFGNLYFAPREGGVRNGVDATIQSTDIQNQSTRVYAVGAKQQHFQERRESLTGVQYQWENVDVEAFGSSQNRALSLNREVILREVDNVLNPRSGYFATLQVNAATKVLLSDQNFLRVYGRGVYFYPISKQDSLVLRSEIGVTFAPNTTGIPTSFLYRTGGAQTVRGYAYQSLGVKEGNAVVGGRYLFVASIEYVRWIVENWGAAVFFDAGNAVNQISDMSLVQGYGVGVRWRSPVGSLSADVAYGDALGQFRVDFTIGFRF